MLLSPIVFFAYNRPSHTRRALESLAANEQAQFSELYIFCDSMPTQAFEGTSDAVDRTRKIVREKQWCGHVEIIEATENLGCDGSMLKGINSVISACGRVIVLEDDLVVSPEWLSFVNQAMAMYERDERVGAVSGYMYPVVHRPLPATFFSCFLNFWGWGTWRSAWLHYQPNASTLLEELSASSLLERFMLGRPEYLSYLRALQGKIDSYDILWYATLLARGQLVLYPGKSLVANKGFDLSGTHLAIMNGPNFAFLNQETARVAPRLDRQAVKEDSSATAAVIEANSYIWP